MVAATEVMKSRILGKTFKEITKGAVCIKPIVVTEQDVRFANLRSMMHGEPTNIKAGIYTGLYIKGDLVMSDTPDELNDHYYPYLEAKDHCLINGLGLGCIAQGVLSKEEVTEVTIIEIQQDVIDIVGSYLRKQFPNKKLNIICEDALKYKAPKNMYYGMVWNDIWTAISLDNLEEMAILHRKYGKRAEWLHSWKRDYLHNILAQERRWG